MLCKSVLIAVVVVGLVAQAALGSDHPCKNIGDDMPKDYEPSGLVWHDGLEQLFVVSDEGSVGAFTHTGNLIDSWDLPSGDVEGLTIEDPFNGTELWVAQEYPPTLLEWSLETHKVTGRSIALPHFPADAKSGMEGVTYDWKSQTLYGGSQFDGNIYAYKVNFAKAVAVPAFNITTHWTRDCSGLTYVHELNQIVALSDTYDEMLIFTPDGTPIAGSPVPADGQEGLAYRISHDNTPEVFVANDNGKKDSTMWRYDYPIQAQCFSNTDALFTVSPVTKIH